MKEIILSVFLGWSGAYQFYKGNIGKGFLYLFTGGLFGIGWLLDIVSALKNTSHKKAVFSQSSNDFKTINTPKITVEMQDGSIEEFSENFIITDGINCVTCGGDLYHTSFDCEALKWEREKYKESLKALTIKEAKSKGFTYCYECSSDNYNYRHGRFDDMDDLENYDSEKEDF